MYLTHKVTISQLVNRQNKNNMKLFLPLFFFSLFFSFPLFSQNKIGQIAYAQWDAEAERWNYYSFDNWSYDEEDREDLFFHRDSRHSDYLPTNNLNSTSTYDQAGNLKEKNNYHFGLYDWYNEYNEYRYDAEQELTEKLITWSFSQSDQINQQKYVYEKDEIENRKTTKIYEKNEVGKFILRSQIDSFFNDQNCLRKENLFNFYDDGSIQFGRSVEMEFVADCQLYSTHYYKWDVAAEVLEESDKYIYEYSNAGKFIVISHFEFNHSLNQWETKSVSETEFDDNMQRVRYFAETFRNNYIDSLLVLNSYTSKEEVETHQRYATENVFNEGRRFRHVRSDSFSYHYDWNDQLTLKEDFLRHYSHSTASRLYTSYTYYCNGQLKSEIYGGENPYSRKDYRYDGGVDCPLDENEKPLLIFPNPTSGKFTIQSNLLHNSNTTIQVFTILGQEIFHEKINQSSYQYQLDLGNFEKGNYIIRVSNEGERVSEKLIVF